MNIAIQILFVFLFLVTLIVIGLIIFTHSTVRRAHKASPASGIFIYLPSSPHPLHVLDCGHGPTLLLIHGLSSQLGAYNCGIIEHLARKFRVVAVDRPGSGYSVRGSHAVATLDSQADALAELIDIMNLGKTIVVGHSLGGAVALALALRHPEQVSGLCLIAPLTHMPEAVPPAFKALMIASPHLRTVIAWTLAVPAMIVRRKQTLALLFGPESVTRDYVTKGGALLNLRPSQFIASSADLHAIPTSLSTMQMRYGEIKMPVEILFGRGDQILSPKTNGDKFVAKVPTASLTMVDGGHMLPVTQAAMTANFIESYAQKVLA